MRKLVLCEYGCRGQHLIADEALVSRRGSTGVRARVRLQLGAGARALAAVRALQRHRTVLPSPLLCAPRARDRGSFAAPTARRARAFRFRAVIILRTLRPG